MSKRKTYVCPKCGNRVELFLTPSDTPNCVNHEAHKSRKYMEMEEEEKQ